MANKRNGAVKGLIVFLAVMAALTFFSQTIYRGTLPKVETARVNGGVLQAEISGGEFLIDAEKVIRVDIARDLIENKLRVENVTAHKMKNVQKDEVLLSFDAVAGENALANAKVAHERAQEALTAWDQKYQAAWQKILSDMGAATKKMLAPDADFTALNEELNTLQTQQKALEQMRILDGVSRAEKEQALENTRATLGVFKGLSQTNWQLRSPEAGLVADVRVKPGEDYAGLLPLVRLIPTGQPIFVGIESGAQVKIPDLGSVLVYAGQDAPRSQDTGWTFTKETVSGGKRVFWAEPPEGIAAVEGLTKLTLRVDSEYYQHLVPNSAVVGDAVYVLDSRIGAFGEEEYFARKVEIRGQVTDAKNTYVPTGLSGMDRVIAKWDRPFADGDTVVLPLD